MLAIWWLACTGSSARNSVVSGQAKPRRVAEAGFGPIPDPRGTRHQVQPFNAAHAAKFHAPSRHGQGHYPGVRSYGLVANTPPEHPRERR